MSSDHGEERGVSLADEETMLWHLDAFCVRIRQILDVINTLTQFTKTIKVAIGLPKPRSEDLVYDERPRAKASHSKEEIIPGTLLNYRYRK